MRVSIDSGGHMPLTTDRHATISLSRAGPKHDQRRLRVLHVYQPLLGHAQRTSLGLVQVGRRAGLRKTSEAVLRSQAGTRPILSLAAKRLGSFTPDAVRCAALH